MKRQLFLLSVVAFLIQLRVLSYGQQSTPKDYFNEEVRTGQSKTARKLMAFLENQNVTQALQEIDKAYQSSGKVAVLLREASLEIQKVKAKADLLVVIVYSENHNIYRCRYFKKNSQTEDVYLVDLHFNEGDPHSKIVTVTTKDGKVLAKERKEREETMKGSPPPFPGSN